MSFCRHCGTQNNKEARFCISCGKELVFLSKEKTEFLNTKTKESSDDKKGSISMRFDISTGNPRKLFRHVKDAIVDMGYNIKEEKEPVISTTPIRDTGAFEAFLKGEKGKYKEFRKIFIILGTISIIIAMFVLNISASSHDEAKILTFSCAIGLIVGGLILIFYRLTFIRVVFAKFTGEVYYGGKEEEKTTVSRVRAERVAMLSEVRIYLEGTTGIASQNNIISKYAHQKDILLLHEEFDKIVEEIKRIEPIMKE